MKTCVAQLLRKIAFGQVAEYVTQQEPKTIDLLKIKVALNLEGDADVKPSKYRKAPEIKPKRRRPSFQNKSQRSDYMKQYMQDYRGDKGKDYQKKPDNQKELLKKQRQRLKDKFNLKGSSLWKI